MAETQAWRSDLEQLINEMFHLTDTGQADKCVAYVAQDFTMRVAGREIGYERYAELMDERTRATYSTRHCATNLRLVGATGDGLTISYVVTAQRIEGGKSSVMVGDFTDTWTNAGDRWVLSERELALALRPAEQS
jgi:hypothetical protein